MGSYLIEVGPGAQPLVEHLLPLGEKVRVEQRDHVVHGDRPRPLNKPLERLQLLRVRVDDERMEGHDELRDDRTDEELLPGHGVEDGLPRVEESVRGRVARVPRLERRAELEPAGKGDERKDGVSPQLMRRS